MAHKHKLNTFHLFAGAGGGILADLLLGHNPIGACEIEPYPRDVLLARQRDGILPNFPIWDDVCTLDGTPWRGTVDVLCGGFPCQDISAAGKGAGITGERSGLWKEYARLIGEMRPRFVFAENSPLLRTRGLGVVLEDLAALGYNARWGVLGARDVGAPHKRDRMWVLAYANNNGNSPTKESKSIAQGSNSGTSRPKQTIEPSGLCASRTNGSMEGSPEELAYSDGSRSRQDSSTGELRTSRIEQPSEDTGLSNQTERGEVKGWWHTDPAERADSTGKLRQQDRLASGEESQQPTHGIGGEDRDEHTNREESPTEPIVGRVANGVANRVDRLKAIGNGQVPQCAAMAFSILSEGLI
jgi:DNA (cytosine-5)-methyltransferase 1